MNHKIINEVWKRKPNYYKIIKKNNLIAIVEDIIDLSINIYGYKRLYSKARYKIRKLELNTQDTDSKNKEVENAE